MLGLGAADSQGHLMGTPVLAVVVGTHFCIPIPGPWGARCCLYAGRGFCRQSLHTSPTPFPPHPPSPLFSADGKHQSVVFVVFLPTCHAPVSAGSTKPRRLALNPRDAAVEGGGCGIPPSPPPHTHPQYPTALPSTAQQPFPAFTLPGRLTAPAGLRLPPASPPRRP